MGVLDVLYICRVGLCCPSWCGGDVDAVCMLQWMSDERGGRGGFDELVLGFGFCGSLGVRTIPT